MGAVQDPQRQPPRDRFRTLLTVGASLLVGIALTISVMQIAESDSARPQLASTVSTVANAMSAQNPEAEQTDLNTSETTFGTLRWTRISGDRETVPGSMITQTADGLYVAIEGDRTWRSEDGSSWIDAAPLEGLEGARHIWIEGEWAIGGSGEVATSGEPQMSRLFARDNLGWRDVGLPLPSLPEIKGIAWSVGVAMPVERNGTTIVQASAHGEIPWGDHYGVSEFHCGAETCRSGPFGWLERDNVWTITPPTAGSALASVAMTVTADTIEFEDSATGERVHVIEANESWGAQQIADKLADGSLRVSGVFVQEDGGPFAFHETPFHAQPNHVFAVDHGGFAALEILVQEFGSTEARMWTSEDAIAWVDRGAPSLLGDSNGEWIVIEKTETGDAVARLVLDPGSGSGDQTFESFETSNGVDWTPAEPSRFPLHTRFFEANFGEVAIATSPSTHRFWLSTDGDNWEEVEGPPGPHSPDGAGGGSVGAVGDILWVLVVENSGPRTLWIGTFE